MNFSRRFTAAAVSAALAILCSCTPRIHRLTADDYTPASAEEKSRLIAAVEKQNGQIRSARARIDARLRHRAGEEKPTLVAVFMHPDLLRLEFFATALNRLSGLVIADQGALHALNLNRMQAYRGAPSADNLQKLLKIPFIPEEFMYWLSGRLPLAAAQLQDSEVLQHKGAARALMIVKSGDRMLKLLLDTSACAPPPDSGAARCPLLIASEILDRGEQTVLYSSYSYGLTGEENAPFPSQIAFSLPELDVSGELTMREVRINADLSPQKERLFSGRIPPAMDVINLDEMVRDSVEPFF